MAEVTLTVNGTEHTVARPGERTLLAFLRHDLDLVGTKNGCGTGECGTCTVLVDGKARRACTQLLSRLHGATVTTIEGLSAGGSLHPIQDAFVRHGAIQCGFCTPGMVMATKALLDSDPSPSDAAIRKALKGNLCRCTGYLPFIRAVRELAEDSLSDRGARKGVDEVPATPPGKGTYLAHAIERGDHLSTDAARPGFSPIRKDAPAKVQGERIFADDFAAPGQLYGAFRFADHPHARLLSVDTSAAGAMDGVACVLTAADLPGRNGFGLMVPHQPVFADGIVRYRGEVVAAVFAESEEAARRGAEAISARWETLAPAMDAEANMAADAQTLHEGGNVAEHYVFTKGDPDEAFREADIVIEGEYETPSVEHGYLEPEACLAVPDDGTAGAAGLTVYTHNQGSFRFREMIAKSLDVSENRVRVVYTPCGGGFGGKEEPTVQIHCALAALKTGRPAKMRLNREESIRISTKRHASKVRMKHGAKADGTVIACKSEAICDAGAYMSLTQPVVFRATVMASGPYEIPNVHAEAWGVYTTKNPSGAFRGFGSTQVTYAVEIQMDRIARAAGVDPIELRRRHGLAPGRVNAFGHRVSTGVGYLETLDAVERELAETVPRVRRERKALRGAEFTDRADVSDGATGGRYRLGVGVASSYKNVGLGKGVPDGAGATVEIAADGAVTIYVGATDMGQGSDTVFAQLAADELGCAYDIVHVVSSDTARCPDGGMTTASRQTFVTGNAVVAAARALKNRVFGGSAPTGDAVVDRALFAATVERAGGPIREELWYDAPKTYPLQRYADHRAGVSEEEFAIHFGYCFASQAAIVEVDVETGAVEVLSIIAAQDAGKALHRQNILGQIEGGVMMGLGYALHESYAVDDRGIGPVSLRQLGIVRITDMPEVVSHIVEVDHVDGPRGAKGLGEVPLNPTAPAVANAIADAVGSYPSRLPIGIER